MNTNDNYSFLTSKLFRKFLVWFLLIALVPAAYLSYSSYNNARQIIEKEGLINLISIAEQRVQQIDTFFMEKERFNMVMNCFYKALYLSLRVCVIQEDLTIGHIWPLTVSLAY